jgi:uncharacterized protein YkwD
VIRFIAALLAAQTGFFSYEDADGVTVIVEKLEQVPAKFKKSARRLSGESDVELSVAKTASPAHAPAAPPAPSEEDLATAKSVLAALNAVRVAHGLGLVELNPSLSEGCAAHARYLAKNRAHPSTAALGAHDEKADLPGYSADGQRAGKRSVIAMGAPGLDAVKMWLDTYYHRIPLLHPKLVELGFGSARTAGKEPWAAYVLDTSATAAVLSAKQVVTPFPEQANVPVAFTGEHPEPLPGKALPLGYPITVTFHGSRAVTEVSARLSYAGGDVEAYVDVPEKPWVARHGGLTVALLAKKPLAPNTRYVADVSAKVDGMPWSLRWGFTTAPRPKR